MAKPIKINENESTNVILVGMAGSGKTTLMSILSNKINGYLVNLDPACNDPPYSPNIDILFTWSASGAVLTESFASFAPTVYLFVVDTARCVDNPNTFMANMTYACSIMYKTKLPLIVVFTKTDVKPCDVLNEWMDDYEKYMDALNEHASFSNELQRSLCLALDEFYNTILHCGVSSLTGEGIDELLGMIEKSKTQYREDYLVQMKKKKEENEKKDELKKQRAIEAFEKDKETVDGEFCGAAGLRMFGEEDEGIVFRNGQRFFFGKTLDENEN
ncbi:GPN-loop GTPase [Entamoeba marina]